MLLLKFDASCALTSVALNLQFIKPADFGSVSYGGYDNPAECCFYRNCHLSGPCAGTLFQAACEALNGCVNLPCPLDCYGSPITKQNLLDAYTIHYPGGSYAHCAERCDSNPLLHSSDNGSQLPMTARRPALLILHSATNPREQDCFGASESVCFISLRVTAAVYSHGQSQGKGLSSWLHPFRQHI